MAVWSHIILIISWRNKDSCYIHDKKIKILTFGVSVAVLGIVQPRQCSSPELHSLSEVFRTTCTFPTCSVPSVPQHCWFFRGRSRPCCLDGPMGVLIYCYAMRSNRCNQHRTESHLVLDYTKYQALQWFADGLGLGVRRCWHCPIWSISCTSGVDTVHAGLTEMCDG